jgi:fused signal recognition particle receptor
MFDSLKKKFSSWVNSPIKAPAKKEKPAKVSKTKIKKTEKKEEKPTKKEKPQKQEKTKQKRIKPSKEQLEQERKISSNVLQEIKQQGLDTTAIDTKVHDAIAEIKKEEKQDAEIDEENIELEIEEEQSKGKLKPEDLKNKVLDGTQERKVLGEPIGVLGKEKKGWWPFGKKKKDEDKTPSEEPKSDNIIVEEKESFFSKLAKKLTTDKLKEEDFEDAFQDLEITLLENNTALEAVDKIKESLKKALVNKEIKKSEIQKTIISALKDSITSILIEPPNLIEQIKSHEKESKEPFTILFFGINGSGKTTSIAKLAHLLKKNNISSVMAAADTFRAASIEQLETHANAIGVPIIKSDYGSDPASIAFEAKKYASHHKISVVLIDTAGRMYTKSNLMKEMEKIVRVSKPNLKIFVGESITGNDATEQCKMFSETAGIDGIILSKADIDEKAGTILSVSQVTGKPIYFLGTGQEYPNLTPFTKKEVLKNLGLD